VNEALCTELVRHRAVSYDPSIPIDSSWLPCEQCGRWKTALERHHRKFRSRGGLWTPANVLLLCRDCHAAATDEAPWVAHTGLNVHTWEDPDQVPVKVWYEDAAVLLDDLGGYSLAG